MLSSAIAKGLYHPRCKDSHTTYFPGISTADDSWTKEELAALGQEYEQEQKQQYAERQADRFSRLAEYSLDEDNRKKYAARAEEWKEQVQKTNIRENIIGKVDESVIMESELGRFKQKLRADENISKEYYSVLKNKFSHGKENAKNAFNKFVPQNSVGNTMYENTASFNTTTKKISMHYIADLNSDRGAGVTWFHEHGHLIDDAIGVISDN